MTFYEAEQALQIIAMLFGLAQYLLNHKMLFERVKMLVYLVQVFRSQYKSHETRDKACVMSYKARQRQGKHCMGYKPGVSVASLVTYDTSLERPL